ncbi:MAG TPA: DUF2237 domain-containing protein [Bacteroidetes bacterium]|nr:DUF2237 domain-containing protein [Bacteroidota bacterium]
MKDKNVFGDPLITCGQEPITGYFRDGCCNTDDSDLGMHTVCIVATEAFLEYSYEKGNDLTTPMPHWGFPGIKPGDKWCLCALRFKQAMEDGYAPKVVLEATNEKTLDILSMDELLKYAYYKK